MLKKPEKKDIKEYAGLLSLQDGINIERFRGYNQCWDEFNAWHEQEIGKVGKEAFDLMYKLRTQLKLRDDEIADFKAQLKEAREGLPKKCPFKTCYGNVECSKCKGLDPSLNVSAKEGNDE